jgi:GNAT superfamily N-acetyltransferase
MFPINSPPHYTLLLITIHHHLSVHIDTQGPCIMARLPTLNIGTASSPIVAVFGEANSEQRLACYKLGATAFLPPLTPAQYIEREEFVSTLPLSQDNGSRIWCVYREDDPNRVVSTCRTIDRDLIVRDAHGVTRRERGYCIASVVSDQEYRERGLASFLLEQVAEWMDGPGQGVADFLYTSNRSAVWQIPPRYDIVVYGF